MKKVLVGTFYILQGIGNFILGLSTSVEGSYGAPGGVLAGLEIMIKTFLVFVSCLSLITALILFLKLEDWSLNVGIITSAFFCMFYGWMALISYNNLVRPHDITRSAFWLMISIIIVVLNALAPFFLYSLTKNKSV